MKKGNKSQEELFLLEIITHPNIRILVMMRPKSNDAKVARMRLVEFLLIFGRLIMIMQIRLPIRPTY